MSNDTAEAAAQLPVWDQPVRYIDRTHAWYNALGTNNPYQYAHFLDVPFQAMQKPLSQCRVALLTTAAPYQPEKGPQGKDAPYNAAAKFYEVYSGDTSQDHDLRVSHVGIDRAQITDDSNTWFPLQALRRAAAQGIIGSVSARFHGMPTNRSQRHTMTVDCPEVLARCRADGVDVAVLVADLPPIDGADRTASGSQRNLHGDHGRCQGYCGALRRSPTVVQRLSIGQRSRSAP